MRRSVIIIQHDRKLRDEFEVVVNSEADTYCIGSYASVKDALLQIGKDKPDVILMNVRLQGVSGIACLNFCEPFASTVQTIMATTCGDAESVVQALAASVNGRPVESGFPEQFMRATPNAEDDGVPMGASTVRVLLQNSRHFGAGSPKKKNLSPREQQVFDLLATGLIDRKIAIRMNIGVETVRSHIKHIRRKLHVRNRIEAIANYWQSSQVGRRIRGKRGLRAPKIIALREPDGGRRRIKNGSGKSGEQDENHKQSYVGRWPGGIS